VTERDKTAGKHTDRRRYGWVRILLLVLPLLLAATPYARGEERRVVRVGIFQNDPIVFQDEGGAAKGLYVDLLNAIAEEENWEIRYVLDSWDGCLERLRTSDIDLMSCISYAEERDPYADFSRETVWTLWGTLFVHPESDIEDVRSLDGKKVAILKSGINGINFRKLCKEFGVACDIVDLPSFDAVLAAVESGEVEAGVVNSVFGAMHGAKYRVNPSSIIFSPVNTFFAVPEGKNGDLTAIVDAHLRRWKQDKKSVYHRSLDRWLLHGSESVPVIPTWILTGLSVFALVSLFLFLWTRVLRRQVNARTASLRKSRDELRASEENLRLIIDTSPVGICTVDPLGNFVMTNLAYEQMLGYSKEELRGLSFFEVTHPADRPKNRELFQSLFSLDSTSFSMEKKYVGKDGAEIDVAVNATGVMDATGHARFGTAFVRDISARRQAEAEVHKLNAELEQRVSARTADLQRSNQELAEFTYSVSHDLRAPLRHLTGYSELLQRNDRANLDDKARRHLIYISEAAVRMGRLIDDLLAFSRAGRADLRKSPVNLDELVQAVIQVELPNSRVGASSGTLPRCLV